MTSDGGGVVVIGVVGAADERRGDVAADHDDSDRRAWLSLPLEWEAQKGLWRSPARGLLDYRASGLEE
jgi:hypothetical protein